MEWFEIILYEIHFFFGKEYDISNRVEASSRMPINSTKYLWADPTQVWGLKSRQTDVWTPFVRVDTCPGWPYVRLTFVE